MPSATGLANFARIIISGFARFRWMTSPLGPAEAFHQSRLADVVSGAPLPFDGTLSSLQGMGLSGLAAKARRSPMKWWARPICLLRSTCSSFPAGCRWHRRCWSGSAGAPSPRRGWWRRISRMFAAMPLRSTFMLGRSSARFSAVKGSSANITSLMLESVADRAHAAWRILYSRPGSVIVRLHRIDHTVKLDAARLEKNDAVRPSGQAPARAR